MALLVFGIFCLIFSLIWRDFLPCLGISKPPKNCIVSLEKDKSLSSNELKAILSSVVEKLNSKGQPIYLCHNKGYSFSIKRGYQGTNFSTGNDIVCSIYGYVDGQILVDDRGTFSYNTFLITGNYFISKKRTEENRKFFNRFVAELVKTANLKIVTDD